MVKIRFDGTLSIETIVFFSIVMLIHLYLFWRTGSAFLLGKRILFKIAAGLGVFLSIFSLFFLVRLFDSGSTHNLTSKLAILFFDWFVFILLCLLLLLLVEVVTGFGFFFKKLAPKLRGIVLSLVFLLAFIGIVQGIRPPVIENYIVYLPNLPEDLDGTVLVAIADTHINSWIDKSWMEARVSQIQAQQPDLVVLLGDIIELRMGNPPQWDVISVLSSLSAPLGVWAVLGNHESYGKQDTCVSIFDAAGFKTLRNSWAEVKPGLVLAGLDHHRQEHFTGQDDDPVSLTFKDRPPGTTIFLSHVPWQAERAAKMGASLMLSGHTHGGQVWPIDYFMRKRLPLFEGRYEVDGMTVIVSRGAGTYGPRMRLWCPGEILRITLHKEEL